MDLLVLGVGLVVQGLGPKIEDLWIFGWGISGLGVHGFRVLGQFGFRF